MVEVLPEVGLEAALTTAGGGSLLSSVEFFARELDQPGGLADMPIAREQLEAFIMTQLLHTTRQFSDELLAPEAPARKAGSDP